MPPAYLIATRLFFSLLWQQHWPYSRWHWELFCCAVKYLLIFQLLYVRSGFYLSQTWIKSYFWGKIFFLSAKYISDRSFLELPFLSIPWLMCFSVQALLFLDGRKKYLANGRCHLAKPWHQHSSILHPTSLLPTSTPKEGEEDERAATPPHLHTCNSACMCCLPRNQRTSMDYIPPTELPAQRVGFFKARYEELSF